MNGIEIADYFKQFKGIEHEYKIEWEAERFLLAGKMVAMMGTEKTNRPVLTLKVAPEHSIELRLTQPEVFIEGYYMNKVHWISIYLDQRCDINLMKSLIQESYQLILHSLPKKIQKELIES